MRSFIFLLLIALVCIGCGPKPQPQNPCDQFDCGGNGACVVKNEQPVCSCKKTDSAATSWYGSKCALRPMDLGFATKEICEKGGELTLSGLVGEAADLNGRQITFEPGAVSSCVILVVAHAQAQPQDHFGDNGKVFIALGVAIFALGKEMPFTDKGSRNLIQPKADSVKYFIPGKRTSFVYYDSSSEKFVPLPTTITEKGSIVTLDRLRSVYNGDQLPRLTAKAAVGSKGELTLDVNGTVDEGSQDLSLLKFKASMGGTPVELKDLGGGKFRAILPPGNHDLQVVVTDSYGNEDVKTLTVDYDPCKDAKCNAWQTCNKTTGKCEGDSPCTPNYCGNHGSCSVEGAEPVCKCVDGWSGSRCEVAPTPRPEITFAELDCSRHAACGGGNTYDLNFKFKNATRFEIKAEVLTAPPDFNIGSFSATSGDLTGESHMIKFSLGGPSPAEVLITITVFGSAGKASKTLKITYY